MERLADYGRVVKLCDMELYYQIRGGGEPLLLLHGGGGIGANWELFFPAPPPQYQLIIPDLRGHGRSANPTPSFTIKKVAEDIFGLLDQLGIDKFKAIGVSLGAKTLLHLATQQPARILAMVLVSAAPYFPPQARQIMSALTPESRTEVEWQQMRQWHPQGDEQILALWQQLRAFKDSYDDLNFTPPYLSTITAATLIVHGDRDPLYPVNLALEMYQAIAGAALWIIPQSGHIPILAEHTKEGVTTSKFIAVALNFLNAR